MISEPEPATIHLKNALRSSFATPVHFFVMWRSVCDVQLPFDILHNAEEERYRLPVIRFRSCEQPTIHFVGRRKFRDIIQSILFYWIP